MAWTEEEILNHQIKNKQVLAEINATLQPIDKNKGNIGIFAFGQNGDAMVCSSVLKYKDELWPDKNIIWFCNMPIADFLKYSKEVNEVRPWPWAGNGLPIGSEDYWPMLTTDDNKLNQTLKLNFKDTADIEEGYFPCPFMLSPQKRHGLAYSNCSRKIFGIPNDYPWHPVLNYSEIEKSDAIDFINEIDGKRIFFETFAGSSQSIMSEQMIREAMKVCREKWGNCTFVFPSHKFLRAQEKWPDDFFIGDTTSCSEFTVRQCGLIAEQCDLMISVSSGITVSASAWGLQSPPCLQYCGSAICGTKEIFSGDMIQVFADNKSKEESEREFINSLSLLLDKYK